ncbi:MAG: hypothetical protein H6704_21615 [Myxococcales bacterium]|nr:hypothetical protein [Myxococcales bacterium]MCB9538841.1 hypothetical protein [Myxococcales bacterium]
MADAAGPQQGLFAFDGDDFYHHFQDTAQLDHVAWFGQIGLPDHGPGFDAILRGKVIYDVDLDQHVVGFYGAPYLSNPRYNLVIEAFHLDEERVLERRLDDAF